MSTPTPRTDEARRIDNGDTHPLLDEMEQMERELAAERARLDWLEDHGWITGEPCDRAAIDAAMKEDGK